VPLRPAGADLLGRLRADHPPAAGRHADDAVVDRDHAGAGMRDLFGPRPQAAAAGRSRQRDLAVGDRRQHAGAQAGEADDEGDDDHRREQSRAAALLTARAPDRAAPSPLRSTPSGREGPVPAEPLFGAVHGASNVSRTRLPFRTTSAWWRG
jgi:hypothetical protein